MNRLAHRVVARYLAAVQETREQAVPARNRETGRGVWVLPSTLREHPERFSPATEKEFESDPDKERRPRRPAKPRKPRRPERHRVPFPIPEPYVKPPLPPKRIKPVKRVPLVKPIPVVRPPKPRQTPLVPNRRRYKEGWDGE